MKLQYLSDSRDAFKWDLLHWLCTQSTPAFSKLVFVPLLTADDATGEGKTPHRWFPCRPMVRAFVESLGTEPRTLERVKALGGVEAERQFEVFIAPEDRYLPSGPDRIRAEYWSGWGAERHEHSVVFFDPDIGFETKSDRGTKYVRHQEIERTLQSVPVSSVVVVYQHRPHLTWTDAFYRLVPKLGYAEFVFAVHEANLAFVVLTKDPTVFRSVSAAADRYCSRHDDVWVAMLKGDLDRGAR